MDAFVTKRPRESDGAEEAGKNPKSAKGEAPVAQFGGLTTLALCSSNESILALEAQAVEHFGRFPLEKWYDLGQWLHNRQLLFGPRPGSHRTPHEETIPDVLMQIFKHARESMLKECPSFGDIPETPTGCAVNRYAVTDNGRGNGLGPHQDKGAWIPLVIGVTLVESRKMSFSNGYKARATERHTFTTEAGSVYGFRDEMYTRWFHESLKKGKSQKQTIYSVTYRFLA